MQGHAFPLKSMLAPRKYQGMSKRQKVANIKYTALARLKISTILVPKSIVHGAMKSQGPHSHILMTGGGGSE